MSTLHIVSRSPWCNPAFEQCLRVVRAGDALLLAGDGVNAALPHSEPSRALAGLAGGIRVHALEDDCTLRGLHTLAGGVRRIDYQEFVALCCEHSRSVSWF